MNYINDVFFERSRIIYERLQDEKSRSIFGKRILWNLTGDIRYIHDIIRQTDEGKQFIEELKQIPYEKEIFLFGAGGLGHDLLLTFPDIKWTGFIENNPKAEKFMNLPVVSFESMIKEHKDAFIVISSKKYFNEMLAQCIEAKIEINHIINAGKYQKILDSRDYLDLPQLNLSKEEAVVDCGAFDGLSALNFINWVSDSYAHLYEFEPDSNIMKVCKKNLAKHSNISFIEKGVWNKIGVKNFDNNGSCTYLKNGYGGTEPSVPVTSLDAELGDKRITFIKMDIEGSELQALKGAEKLIREQSPKIAARIYHKWEDPWYLPEKILEYDDSYCFYIRHFSLSLYDTVLFAISNK